MDQSELIGLCDAMHDGTIAPGDAERLVAALRGSRELRRLYWRAMLDHQALHGELQRAQGDQAARQFTRGRDRSAPAARRPRWSGRLLAAAGLLVACGALILAALQAGRESYGTVIISQAGLQVEGDDRQRTDRLRPGQRLVVHGLAGTSAGAEVHLPDGVQFGLTGGSRIRWTAEDDQDSSFVLEAGTLWADVPPRHGRALVIGTPHAAVSVLGTRFSLTAEEEQTRITVASGRVRLSNASASLELAGGASAVAEAGRSPRLAPPLAALAAAVPEAGLRLWLEAGSGVRTDAEGRVAQWRARVGGNALQDEPAARPDYAVDPQHGPLLVFRSQDPPREMHLPGLDFDPLATGATWVMVVRVDREGPQTVWLAQRPVGTTGAIADSLLLGTFIEAIEAPGMNAMVDLSWRAAEGPRTPDGDVPGSGGAYVNRFFTPRRLIALVVRTDPGALLVRFDLPGRSGRAATDAGDIRRATLAAGPRSICRLGTSRRAQHPHLEGAIAGLLLYDRELSDPEVQRLLTALSDHYRLRP